MSDDVGSEFEQQNQNFELSGDIQHLREAAIATGIELPHSIEWEMTATEAELMAYKEEIQSLVKRAVREQEEALAAQRAKEAEEARRAGRPVAKWRDTGRPCNIGPFADNHCTICGLRQCPTRGGLPL